MFLQDGPRGGSSREEGGLQPAVWHLGSGDHSYRVRWTSASYVWSSSHEVLCDIHCFITRLNHISKIVKSHFYSCNEIENQIIWTMKGFIIALCNFNYQLLKRRFFVDKKFYFLSKNPQIYALNVNLYQTFPVLSLVQYSLCVSFVGHYFWCPKVDSNPHS